MQYNIKCKSELGQPRKFTPLLGKSHKISFTISSNEGECMWRKLQRIRELYLSFCLPYLQVSTKRHIPIELLYTNKYSRS